MLLFENLMHGIDLQLFADGAGGADGGASAGVTGSDAGAPMSVNAQPAQAQNGVTEPSAEAQSQARDYDAEFDAFINGDYKAQYEKRVNDAVNKSVRSRVRSMNEELKQYQQLTSVLADRYGLEGNKNLEAIMNAIEEEDRPGLADRAYKNNVSEEAQRYIDKLEAKERRHAREESERIAAQREEARMREVAQQAAQLKQKYPGFDFEADLNTPKFRALLDLGVDVESAYIATHHDSMMASAMQYTAQQIEQKVVNNVRANGVRPSENGTSRSAPVQQKRDPASFTKAEREEIARRARRGEDVFI